MCARLALRAKCRSTTAAVPKSGRHKHGGGVGGAMVATARKQQKAEFARKRMREDKKETEIETNG